MRELLPMFTIYDHPLDYPESYVVRKWLIGKNIINDGIVIKDGSLEVVRMKLKEMGLVNIGADGETDPKILENWI